MSERYPDDEEDYDDDEEDYGPDPLEGYCLCHDAPVCPDLVSHLPNDYHGEGGFSGYEYGVVRDILGGN